MISNPQPLHPGIVLAEVYMAEMGLNQTSLANLCQCAPRKINEIVNGKRAISASFASTLESVLGTSAKEANACRRVARRLLKLPELTQAAENGSIDWTEASQGAPLASIAVEGGRAFVSNGYPSHGVQARALISDWIGRSKTIRNRLLAFFDHFVDFYNLIF